MITNPDALRDKVCGYTDPCLKNILTIYMQTQRYILMQKEGGRYKNTVLNHKPVCAFEITNSDRLLKWSQMNGLKWATSI